MERSMVKGEIDRPSFDQLLVHCLSFVLPPELHVKVAFRLSLARLGIQPCMKAMWPPREWLGLARASQSRPTLMIRAVAASSTHITTFLCLPLSSQFWAREHQ